jgi:acyl carrier protein
LLLDEAGGDAEVYGEIGIRSAHAALGYWRQPEMTRSAFLPDPEGGTKRVYRTGDMGRLLSDGSIVFIGRKDFQVKIRGMRIELGEIESVLGQHAGVWEAVVIAREEVDSEGGLRIADSEDANPKSKIESLESAEKRLVAYVVCNDGQALTVDELRGFLKQKLPDYMVPSAFVFLDSLPLTLNGKVNRKALPAPDATRPELGRELVAPRTPVEEALAGIWAKVLKLERVGVRDNFFDLGGHSLLATQVMSRVRSVLKIELPLRDLFEFPTIAGLGERIETVIWAAKSREATSGEREEIRL